MTGGCSAVLPQSRGSHNRRLEGIQLRLDSRLLACRLMSMLLASAVMSSV